VGAEADDVIAVAHRFLTGVPAFCASTVIISNDNDCIQLSDPSTRIVNLFMNDVGRRRGDLTPQQYLESRILAGDRSDNIPGLMPRCGMKTAVRLVTSGALSMQSDHQRAAWARNDILMNLQHTPACIKDAIEDAVARWCASAVQAQSQSVSSP
jgi:5'-3' exonuclease